MKKQKFVILTVEEYEYKYMHNGLVDYYLHMAESITYHLVNTGLDVNAANTIEHSSWGAKKVAK